MLKYAILEHHMQYFRTVRSINKIVVQKNKKLINMKFNYEKAKNKVQLKLTQNINKLKILTTYVIMFKSSS